MKFIEKLKRSFGCDWENINEPPLWLDNKAHDMMPGAIKTFRGKTFVYKVARGLPQTQGAFPVTFYRRLRYSAWKRKK
jgi:hypothetical protein